MLDPSSIVAMTGLLRPTPPHKQTPTLEFDSFEPNCINDVGTSLKWNVIYFGEFSSPVLVIVLTTSDGNFWNGTEFMMTSSSGNIFCVTDPL